MGETISFACVGDVMCGDSFYNIGRGCASSISKYGISFMSPDIVSYFQKHDIVLGNMESPISNKGKKWHSLRSLHMRATPRVAEYLSKWGFSVLNVANNHILEHGLVAAKDTVDHLENNGVMVIGDGQRFSSHTVQAKRVKAESQNVVIYALCLRHEKYAFSGESDLEQLFDSIKHTCSNSPVLVSIHWGNEFIDRPSKSVIELGRKLIDSGACAVIGHHPHVVQGIEEYKHGIIAYSLGNFIFDSFEPDCRWSIILSINLDKNGICEWQYIPVNMDKEHRPCFAAGEIKDKIIEKVKRRCDVLRNDCDDEEYDQQVDDHEKRFRQHLKNYLLNHFWGIPPIYWPQILLRPLQRRLGIW